jgi:hypothetical protein
MNESPQNNEQNAPQPPSPSSETPDWLAQALPPVAPSTQPTAPPIPSPQAYPQTVHPQTPQGDNTGGLIPYKNPQALTGYYVSVFGLIPCVGFLLGPVAIFLGWRGLKYAQQNPHVKGTAHAYVAMILGALEFFGHIGLLLLSIVGASR